MGYKVSGAFKPQQPFGCEDLKAMKSGLTEFVGSALDGKIQNRVGDTRFQGLSNRSNLLVVRI